MHTAVFGNATAAQTAIANGTISNFGAFNNDLAQVGYVTVAMNASGGYVSATQIEKTTFRQTTGGTGVGSTAANVVTSTTNFDKLLSATDTTVQQALETIDEQAVSLASVQTLTGAKTFTSGLTSTITADSTVSALSIANPSTGTSSGSQITFDDSTAFFRMIFPNTENSSSFLGQTAFSFAYLYTSRSMQFTAGTAVSNGLSFIWSFGATALARLYNGSGTAKMFIGNGNIPDANLHVNTSNADLVNVKLSNQGTGRSTTRGFDMRLESGGNSSLWLFENNYLTFGTNNTERIRILSTGQVGIGNTAPKSLLHVSGGVQIGDDTADASADKVGCFRYRTDATNSYVDVCMQTGASTYVWVNIKTNTWS
jgi:hypothetical protein